MKIFAQRFILAAVLVGVCAGTLWAKNNTSLPSPSGYVNDWAGIIEPQDQQVKSEGKFLV